MRIAIIHNPVAGGRRALLGRVRTALQAAGAAITVIPTAGKGDAEAIAARLRSHDYDRIAVAGGDGTLNEAINGLARNPDPPPLGVIPLGTANVLACEIGLRAVTGPVAASLMKGPVRSVSLGSVNGRRFALMAGVGLDAEVVEFLDPLLKRRLGKAAYAIETLRHIARGRRDRFTIRTGGCTFEAELAIVANARHYGGRWIVAPDAALDRPSLELCLFGRAGRGAALGYAAALMLGRLTRARGFSTRSVERLTIDGPSGAPVQADGDIVARLPAEIAVLPASLRLVVPV